MESLQSGYPQQRMRGGSGFMRPVTDSQHKPFRGQGPRLEAQKAVFRSVGRGNLGLGCLARQRIVGAVIQLPDTVSVETFLFNFQISAQKQFRRQFLYGEANCFSGGRKSLIADWTAGLATAARKEFGRGAVVDHRHNQDSSMPNMALTRPKIQHQLSPHTSPTAGETLNGQKKRPSETDSRPSRPQ